MLNRITLLTLLALAMAFSSASALAKRAGPREVAPVVHAGVKYSAPNDTGREGKVEARDAATGKKLWDAVVYSVKIDPALEEDVQWVFITDLKLSDAADALLVTNEKGDRYTLDLKTRTVKRLEKGAGRK